MGHFITEEWKEYEIEFTGKVKYAVSNLGRIKSFTTKMNEGRLLKGSITEGFRFLGYKRQKNNVIKNYQHAVHKMVAEMFIPKTSENQTYVLHLDYDKFNNSVTNLKWATYEEMREHAKNSPNVKAAFIKLQEHNIKNDGAKLRVIDVMRLKKILLNPNRKTRYKILSKQFGVSEMQLHRIKTGENWGHIKV
jgi:hypothetical protein